MSKLERLALAVACTAILSGCSGAESAPRGGVGSGGASGDASAAPTNATFHDGSRLKAVYQRIAGAPPVFLNWYDTQLRIDCTFTDVGLADHPVCFPSAAAGDTDVPTLFAAATSYLFTDRTCTQPVVDVQVGPCQARFFATNPRLGEGCGTTMHLFELGPVLSMDPASLYHLAPSGTGACQAATASDLSSYRELHGLGAEIPLASLVGGTFQHDAAAGRIVPLAIAGSDGSLQDQSTSDSTGRSFGGAAAWDSQRGEIVSTTLGPGDRWFPTTVYSTGSFSDAACSVDTAIGPACGVVAREAVGPLVRTCDSYGPSTFYELGAPVPDQSKVYSRDAGSRACSLYDAGAGSPIVNPMLATFALGAPVPVAAFAAAVEVHAGTGQIQVIQLGNAGDPPAASTGFFDGVHGHACAFQRSLQAADGVVRCLPSASNVEFYADAACAIPLHSSTASGLCDPPPPAFVSITETVPMPDGCHLPAFRSHIFPVRGVHVGDVYEKVGVGPDACFDVGPAVGWSGTTFHATGPEIPATEFAAMDYVRPN